MKIIHTSDWHLGKYLEGYSRLDEQMEFCNDFVELVNREDAKLILIAGDIYDTSNPPANAESLFYDTVTRIADNGKRCVFVIAGNHDNPDRLEAINPLASKSGIIIMGYPKSKAEVAEYEGFKIIKAEEGYTKLNIDGTDINIASLPYPSEKRLNEVFSDFEEIQEMQKTYSEKVGEIFQRLEENFSEGEINIAISHLFVVGSEISDSERRIELGGSLLVNKSDLPKKSQYTALGHIHKPQTVSKLYNAYYSGSPIQYSKTERNTAKSVRIIDIVPDKEADIREEYIKNYKQISLFKCDNIDDALKVCREKSEEDIFAYFEIITDDSIEPEIIREMKKLMKSILEIKPVIKNIDYGNREEVVDINKGNIKTFFLDFYKTQSGGFEPGEDIVKLFEKLISSSEVDSDEAD
ncbi:metallophosphoesterase family protein [Peptostreptococcus canis]|uniref:Nuclease SbcCD subunit D n=1 Tax=Peptostreptococcus canis TaxID=1159213 RepID=A0ABR6TL17_9FIRM|nr:exonuclease subunit SbcD [Peptostreptococcus canis]MBC2576111.1 exonuclease subunit SbcD [Peptostreptococcus canis]MBP1997763.1 exonuclease SbcD [Peptostreptococcus canis]